MGTSFLACRRGRRLAIIAAVAVMCAVCATSLRAAVSTTVVPRLSGGLAAAYARLHAAGLLVNIPRSWTWESAVPPRVIRTIPGAGSRVVPGTAITLYLNQAGLAPSQSSRRVAHPPVPSFVGQRVSAASRWASTHHVSFLAHLGALRRGDAPWLLAGFVVTRQSSAVDVGNSLTVWGRQPSLPAPAKPAPAPPATPPPLAAAADTALPPALTYYQNPVDAADFPDPFVLDNGSTHGDYWAFSTGDLFPILHSTDLVHWSAEPTAMTSRPSWVPRTGYWNPWAPSVIQLTPPCPATGCYVMYYVGASAAWSTSWLLNCIGVATAVDPGGPYTDQGPLVLKGTSAGTLPIGCGDGSGEGNIDPSPFIDPSNGDAYLYLSTDRANVNGEYLRQATVSVIPLGPGLMQASGPRVPLLTGAAGTWEDGGGSEGPTVEGPFMELHKGTYYLFYSGGNWGLAYGMGYATGPSATGPFTKSPGNPILAQTRTVLSPGGGDRLITGPHGGLWLAYHARANSYSDPRTLRIDAFTWNPATPAGPPDLPVIGGPTSTPESSQP